MATIIWKFPGRRKAESFSVYKPEGNLVVIQSSKTIAQVNMKTGRGLLNTKGSGSKYFMHLNEMMGAIKYRFPAELVKKIRKNTPKSGDKIGGNVYWS